MGPGRPVAGGHGGVAACARLVVRRADAAAVPLVVLFVISVFTNINLGLRYVLPIFPYLFISAGKLAPWAATIGNRLRRGLPRG